MSLKIGIAGPVGSGKTSLINLQQKLKNQDFILAKDAAQQLNCAPTWLNEYWCKSGFLTIENLVYWKLVRQEEVDEVLMKYLS